MSRPRKQVIGMGIPLARTHWLLNNNNSPQRQQLDPRNGRSGPGGQSPQNRPSMLNRWLLIIFVVMIGVYLYQYFSASSSSSSAPQRDQLTYTQFYDQINAGNIKDATFNGQIDITGDFRQPVNGYSQYHVYQLPMAITSCRSCSSPKGRRWSTR